MKYFFIIFWFMLGAGVAADLNLTSYYSIGQTLSNGGLRVSLKNIGSGAAVVDHWQSGSWGGSPAWVNVGNIGGSVIRMQRSGVPGPLPTTYAPGQTRQFEFDIQKLAPSGTPGGGVSSGTITYEARFRIVMGGVTTYKTVPISFSAEITRDGGSSPTMSPYPFQMVPVVEFTGLTPPSSVGIFGWTGPDTFLQIEGPTLGSSTFLLAKDGVAHSKDDIVSDSVMDGATYTARMPGGGPVVGTGTVVKESDGHFEVYMLVTPPSATGTIEVGGRPETAGAATVSVAGGGTYEISIPESGSVVVEVPDASGVADGAAITVTRDGQVVGSGVVHKDSGGSFAEVIMTAGEGDGEAADKNDAVFELEVVSFEDGMTNFFLEIDGQTFTPEGGGELAGDPVNGARKTFRVKIPNGEGIISGDDFNWKASGLRDGQIVSGQTVAQGQAPIVPVAFTPDGEMGGIDNEPINGFRDTQTVTVGSPRPSGAAPPSANPYNPTSPDQVAAYQADRKAAADGMRDALKVSGGFGGDGNPSTAQGDAAGKLASGGAGALGQLAGGAGSALGGGMGVAPFSLSSPTLSVTLPILGVVTFDTSLYGAWAGILRLILLAMLVWYATVGGLSIVRGGFAGR